MNNIYYDKLEGLKKNPYRTRSLEQFFENIETVWNDRKVIFLFEKFTSQYFFYIYNVHIKYNGNRATILMFLYENQL